MFSCKRGIASLIRSGQSKMNKMGQRNEHTLPALPYDIKSLEPIISAEIMTMHYTKHHAAYVANLNAAELKFEEARCRNDLSAMIALQPAIRFNGGGHINHSIFWKNLSPNGGKPTCELEKAIKEEFCSMNEMKNQLAAASIAVQGSGWGWLGFNKQTKRLQIATCANQDPLQATTGLVPLFGIDVWEHAYYMQYKNVRAEYVKQIFHIINWDDVSNRFEQAQCC